MHSVGRATPTRGTLLVMSAGLPALGAALAGIRVHGDFEGSKECSDRMIDTLTALEHDYRMAMDRDIGLNESAEMLIRTTRLMSEDVTAWQELYGRKRLTLPLAATPLPSPPPQGPARGEGGSRPTSRRGRIAGSSPAKTSWATTSSDRIPRPRPSRCGRRARIPRAEPSPQRFMAAGQAGSKA
jgi:hypothetical protein